MPKALGIVSLIFGILSFIGFIFLTLLGFLGIVFPFMILLAVIIGIVALILGIVGAATAKGNYSKAPSIVGIVFGAIVLSMGFLIFMMPMGF